MQSRHTSSRHAMLAAYASLVLNDPAVPESLRAAARGLLADPAATAPVDQLIADAHRRLPTDKDHRWHMLYIDAAILKVLARTSGDVDEDTIRDCIVALDRAIIVAGAAIDDNRRDYIVHHIIHQLQSSLPSRPPTAVLVAQSDPVPHLTTCTNTVRVLSGLPSAVSGPKDWSRAPFVVREFARDWPAMDQWASLSYLFAVTGPGRIVPVEVGNDYRSNDWSQKLIAWDDFLASLTRPDRNLYLAQHSLFTQFPKLRDDIIVPDIVYTVLDAPAYYPPHDVILNAWFGPKGTISPAHTDPYFNCYVQVVGRKTVWIAPPNVAAAMYPYQSAHLSMSNTSQVDVFPAQPEISRSAFPLFWGAVPSQAFCVTLCPGDMLFFPPGWWHAMRSEDVSFSVSMWF